MRKNRKEHREGAENHRGIKVNEKNRKQKMAKCKEVLLIKSRRDLRV